MYVYCLFIIYVYINTHIQYIYFENIYMYTFIYLYYYTLYYI